MKKSPRCLYQNCVASFVLEDEDAIFGAFPGVSRGNSDHDERSMGVGDCDFAVGSFPLC